MGKGFVSFLKDVAGILGPIGAIIGGITSLLGILKPPKLPKIEFPKELFAQLNTRIQTLAPLSDEAKRIAQQALQKFSQGELDPRYKAQLDLMYARKKAEALAMLRARGLGGSSIEQEVLNQLDQWYQQNYYALLNQQLHDALTAAGLAQQDINALIEEMKAYGITWAGLGTAMQTGAQMATGQTLGLIYGLEKIGKGLESLIQPKTETTQTTLPTLDFQDLKTTEGLTK
jgi:hypothetical protein